jgi:hypothetical protein
VVERLLVVEELIRVGASWLITLYDCLTQFVHTTSFEKTLSGKPFDNHEERTEIVIVPVTF